MILFDFDGVLMNSVDEIAISAYNLITDSEVYRLKDLPSGYHEIFSFNKHLLLGPSRLGPLASWCLKTLDEGKSPQTFLSREDFLQNVFPLTANDDGTRFYAARQKIIDKYPDEWSRLNQPFAYIWKAVQKLSPEKYLILTYKNRIAVQTLCSFFALEVPAERILSGEGGRTKKQNILEFDSKLENTNYIFVDDAVENLYALTPVLPGRIRGIVAGWGFNTEEDRVAAASKGYEIQTEIGFTDNYLSE